MELTILVLIYNAKKEQVFKTIDSVFEQDIEKVEMIFCDDCSKIDITQNIKDYMDGKEKKINYIIQRNKHNIGTVKNILKGIEIAKGEYIKPIGAGDYFLNKKTLEIVYDKMKREKAEILFSDMVGYKIINNQEKFFHFRNPLDPTCYQEERYELMERNFLAYGDRIAGACIFYEREYLDFALKGMENKIKYCEDLVIGDAILSRKRIYYLKQPMVGYELNTGVTKKNMDFLYKETFMYYEMLTEKYGKKKSIDYGKKMLKVSRIKNSILRKVIKIVFFPRWAAFFLPKRINKFKIK